MTRDATKWTVQKFKLGDNPYKPNAFSGDMVSVDPVDLKNLSQHYNEVICGILIVVPLARESVPTEPPLSTPLEPEAPNQALQLEKMLLAFETRMLGLVDRRIAGDSIERANLSKLSLCRNTGYFSAPHICHGRA